MLRPQHPTKSSAGAVVWRCVHASPQAWAKTKPPNAAASVDTTKKTRAERLAAEQGYFHEMVELQKTKGKPFVAAAGVRAEVESQPFPSVTGDTLAGGELSLPAGCRGKVTLVALSFKQFGFAQLESWVKPFMERVHEKGKSKCEIKPPPVQVVHLSAMEGGFIANLLKGSVLSGLKKVTPPQLHATSLVFVGDVNPMVESLDVSNRLVGHIFLVDKEGRVRWRGCGPASELELGRLLEATEILRS